MSTNEMGYLETVVRQLREATDELKRENDEAKEREVERMLQIHYAHVKSLRDWEAWEVAQREARLVSDDDRR